MAHPTLRRVDRIQNGLTTFEGEGFAVRRPFPVRGLEQIDPFLLLDEMGPMELGPGEAKGAPDHPHRGFETVTYLIAGSFEHRDSAGHAGRLSAGDVQWMTAGDGVVHSEMPSAELRRAGGRLHGFQLWVNLPRRDKRMKPRYQEIPAAEIPVAESADGKVRVRVLAGESLGARAVIDTRTPIMYLHVTVQPGGALVQPLPAGMRAFAWVFGGAGRFDESGRAARRAGGALRALRDEQRGRDPRGDRRLPLGPHGAHRRRLTRHLGAQAGEVIDQPARGGAEAALGAVRHRQRQEVLIVAPGGGAEAAQAAAAQLRPRAVLRQAAPAQAADEERLLGAEVGDAPGVR